MIKKFTQVLILTAVLLNLSGMVFAPHDQGQGKSQDHDQLHDAVSSVSAAPEPLTALLFAVGSGIVFLRLRKQD
ncbi:MAG: hypothetical protein JSU96_19370 [Acidobacteriota bacterium]|nr:MAG: hypothetical protein JSU96_19370 [Acidobacteriota bacterium]